MGKHSLLAAKYAQMYRMKGVVNRTASSITSHAARIFYLLSEFTDCTSLLNVDAYIIGIQFDKEINEITSVNIGNLIFDLPFDGPFIMAGTESAENDKTLWGIGVARKEGAETSICLDPNTSSITVVADGTEYTVPVLSVEEGMP